MATLSRNITHARKGEYIVAAYLAGVGWQVVIADAVGYDIIATRRRRTLRIQVKSSSKPRPYKSTHAYSFSAGVREAKKVKDYYDVLAFVALNVGTIYFQAAVAMRRQTVRLSREIFFDPNISDTSWAEASRPG